MKAKIVFVFCFFTFCAKVYSQEKSHISVNMGWGIIYGLQGGLEYQFNEKYSLGLGGGKGLSAFSTDVVSSFRLDNNFSFGRKRTDNVFRPGCFSLSILNISIDI